MGGQLGDVDRNDAAAKLRVAEPAVEGKEIAADIAHRVCVDELLHGLRAEGIVREVVRATVTLFPYIKEGRNENFDTETIPHPVF